MEPTRVDRILDEHFRQDGPYGAQRVKDAAELVAELVRWLNHATPPWKTSPFRKPDDLGTTVEYFHAALYGLDQLVHQLAGQADAFSQQPTLYHDQMGVRPGEVGDPVSAALNAAAELNSTRARLIEVADALGRASGSLNRLGLRS